MHPRFKLAPGDAKILAKLQFVYSSLLKFKEKILVFNQEKLSPFFKQNGKAIALGFMLGTAFYSFWLASLLANLAIALLFIKMRLSKGKRRHRKKHKNE